MSAIQGNEKNRNTSQNIGNIAISLVILHTMMYTVIDSHPKHMLPNTLWFFE